MTIEVSRKALFTDKMRSSSTILIQRCYPPRVWRSTGAARTFSRSKSTTTSSSSSLQKETKKPLFKADDVIVAEALRNAQYQQHIRAAGTPIHKDEMASVDRGDCQRCGKPLKPPPTVNSTNNLLHCPDCQMLYSTGGTSSSATQKYDAGKTSDAYLRRPPYPSEVCLMSTVDSRYNITPI